MQKLNRNSAWLDWLVIRAKDQWLAYVHWCYTGMYMVFLVAYIAWSWNGAVANIGSFWALTPATVYIASVGLLYAIFYSRIARQNAFFAMFISQMLMNTFVVYTIEISHSQNVTYNLLWVLVVALSAVLGLLTLVAETIIATLVTSFTLAGVIPVPHLNVARELVYIAVGILAPAIAWLVIVRLRGTQDIDPLATTAHQLNGELDEEKTKSTIVLESIGDGVIVVDDAGLVEYANNGVWAIIGWRKADLAGLALTSIITSPQDAQAADWLRQALQSAREHNASQFNSHLPTATKAGAPIFISITVSPITTETRHDGVVVTFQDVTEAYRLELERINFIETASHELRTPIAEIEAGLSIGLAQPAWKNANAQAYEFLERSHASVIHLGNLTSDLLMVSQIESGNLDKSRSATNITELVSHTVSRWETEAAKHHTTVQLHVPAANTPSIQLNQEYITTILNKLLSNATALTADGQIDVTLTIAEANLTITVFDSGPTIASNLTPMLFKKFGRLESHLTRNRNGTGLGLYIAHELANYIGGELTYVPAESGATFKLVLPHGPAKPSKKGASRV